MIPHLIKGGLRNGLLRFTSTLESCWGRSVAFLAFLFRPAPTFPSEKLIKKRKSGDSPWRRPFRRRFLALFSLLFWTEVVRAFLQIRFSPISKRRIIPQVQSLKRIFLYDAIVPFDKGKRRKWRLVSGSRVRRDSVADVYLKYRRLVSFILMLLFELAMEKFRCLCMRPFHDGLSFYIQRIFRCRIGKFDGHIFIGHKRKCKTVRVYRCFILCIFRFSSLFLCTKLPFFFVLGKSTKFYRFRPDFTG